MTSSAHAVQLTVQFREATFERGQELAAEVVRRAHAAGLPSATVRRGGLLSSASVIPSARSVSLADAESLTVCVVGAPEELRRLATQLDDLDHPVVRLEVGGQVRELHDGGGAVLRG